MSTQPQPTPHRSTGPWDMEELLETDFTPPGGSVLIGQDEEIFFERLSKNLIEAPEKNFKTAYEMRFMLGLSCGKTVYKNLPVRTAACRVLYVHGELSLGQIKRRTREAAAGLPRPNRNFHTLRDINIHLIHDKGQSVLRQHIERCQPEYLVLDPWFKFIAGFDENNGQHISLATNFIDQLIEDYGLTVDLCTHTGKDVSRGTRGHSSIAGWRDTLVRLERKSKSEIVTVHVEPRWAEPLEPFNLILKDGTMHDHEGAFSLQAQKMREVLAGNGGMPKPALREALGMGEDAFRMALGRAARCRAVFVDEKGIVQAPRV